MSNLSGKTAIAGIGATEFSKDSGRSELQLAAESILAALTDAGLTPADVDGLVTYTMEKNPEVEVARALGMGDIKYFGRVNFGGGAPGAVVLQAAMAVATGVADVVVCYRAFNERSGRRFGAGVQDRGTEPSAENAGYAWYTPHGLVTPAQWAAMAGRRYMHDSGATTEALGAVAVAARRHAATNPKAWFYERPITLEDHAESRWIAEPLRLLDCCQESDGAQALVIVSAERARDLPQKPAIIKAAAQGISGSTAMMTAYYGDDIGHLTEMTLVADQLWADAQLTPADIPTAIIYDHFTPYVLMQLESFGFCGRGEAKDFVRDGNVELGGRLPINTHGGQLGEAYIHGMNGVAEGVRQIRGTAVNQVADVQNTVVTGGAGVPTSGLILGADR